MWKGQSTQSRLTFRARYACRDFSYFTLLYFIYTLLLRNLPPKICWSLTSSYKIRKNRFFTLWHCNSIFSRRLLASEQVCHIFSKNPHRMQAFCILSYLLGICSMDHIPITRWNNRHFLNGKIFIRNRRAVRAALLSYFFPISINTYSPTNFNTIKTDMKKASTTSKGVHIRFSFPYSKPISPKMNTLPRPPIHRFGYHRSRSLSPCSIR